MSDMINASSAVIDLARTQMRTADPRRLQTIAAHSNPEQLRAVAKEFEAMFINQMLEHMSAGIKTDGPFNGGHGEAMFRSLLNQHYANGISARGGLGIADNVYRQMLAMQES